jgi:hypothetical protein
MPVRAFMTVRWSILMRMTISRKGAVGEGAHTRRARCHTLRLGQQGHSRNQRKGPQPARKHAPIIPRRHYYHTTPVAPDGAADENNRIGCRPHVPAAH